MRSLKSIILACAVQSAGLSLKGELLYWMVGDPSADQFSYAFAGVKDVTGGGHLDYVDEEGVTWTGLWQIDASAFADGFGVYADVGVAGATERSFKIELFNDGGALIAAGETMTYAQLLAAGAIVRSSMERERQQAWTGGAFRAVPEPTSGLLTLVGLAGLALGRRMAA